MRRKLCNFLAAIFSLMLVFPFVYMALDRDTPMLLSFEAIQPNEVVSGTIFNITWTATKKRKFGDGWLDCQGTFIRRFTDSAGFTIESKPQPVESYKLIGETKQTGQFNKQVLVPSMLPGSATYQIITTYWCNPLQKLLPIVHHEQLIHFTVASGQPK